MLSRWLPLPLVAFDALEGPTLFLRYYSRLAAFFLRFCTILSLAAARDFVPALATRVLLILLRRNRPERA